MFLFIRIVFTNVVVFCKVSLDVVVLEVEVLSYIRDPNIVLLLCAYPEFGCLVYKYMNNGSLEDRLFQRGNTPPISWRKRFKIAYEDSPSLPSPNKVRAPSAPRPKARKHTLRPQLCYQNQQCWPGSLSPSIRG